MAGPLGVLAADLTVATSEVENVDGGPPGGASGKVRQRPPPKLKTSMASPLGGAGGKFWQRPPPKLKSSMVGPLGVLAADPAAATSEVEDVDGGPPGECWRHGLVAATTEVEDVYDEPPGGCWRQGPAAATTEVEDADDGPPGGCWR
jgi:hypothetical protein